VRPTTDVIVGQGIDAPFDLDDLTLSTVRLQGPVELPENLRIAAMERDGRATSHLSIHFTPDGFLEPREHREPVRIVLEEEGEARRTEAFRIGLLGVLQDEYPPENP
jgi:hypothetical protein